MGTFVKDWTNIRPPIVSMLSNGAPAPRRSFRMELMIPELGFSMNVHEKALKRSGTLKPRIGSNSRMRLPGTSVLATIQAYVVAKMVVKMALTMMNSSVFFISLSVLGRLMKLQNGKDDVPRRGKNESPMTRANT